MSDPASAFRGARLRPQRGLRAMYGMLVSLGVLVSGVVALVPDLRIMMGAFAAILALPLGLAIRQLRKNSPPGGGRLEARDEGLFVEGRLALPRATLERAVVARDARGVTVSIQRKQGFVSVVDVDSEEQGHAVVRALGLSVHQAVAMFTVDSPIAAASPRWAFYAFLALLAPIFFGPLAAGGHQIAVVLAAVWYAILAAAGAPTKITVGLDGILVRWLSRREVIRYRDITAIDHDGEDLHLTLAGGARRSFSARWTGAIFEKQRGVGAGFGSRAAYLDAIVARVREAIGASRGAEGRVAETALLRQGRDLDAWLGALRGMLVRGARGFREAEATPDQLWSTVEDGGADPSARAAAAIALGPSLDERDRARLREAARVVIAPRLRVAIEAAAGGDDEAVREAIAALEEERGRSTSVQRTPR